MAKRTSRKKKGYSIPQDDVPEVEHAVAEHEAAYEAKKEELAPVDNTGDYVPPNMKPGTMEEIADAAELAAVTEVEEDNAKPNSVVHPRFKDKYLANARANGYKGKAAKRSNWDWLSQRIAEQCLTEKHKLKVAEFLALMDANGVDHSRWTNRNKGWEGRLRMTGRVALQKVVANNQGLRNLDGTLSVAPSEFVAKFRDKE